MIALQKAEVTVFYTTGGAENSEGKPYIRLLPYIKVRLFDPVTNTWDNAVDAYIPHNPLELETIKMFDEPYRVLLERVEDGAFPSNTARGWTLAPHDTMEVHQFGRI